MDYKKMIEMAIRARDNAYAPYSHFKVGACIATSDGKLYTGCNIECATFSPTNCAERTALFKAVSEGERDFSGIAVVGATEGERLELCSPCGVCRQMLSEFVDVHSFRVIMASSVDEYEVKTLEELLPYTFGRKDIMRE
ncbi:MAG: cytidine deaminase [Clostridia bacterium]|nr:cytidine deaminase [Clostridia bacterium]